MVVSSFLCEFSAGGLTGNQAHLSHDLARKFYVSSSTLSHLFKQKMGISIYHYVTQRRLISAKNLISKGMALEQVATRVGFSDYSAFYRVFRQEYGISPRQYRNLLEHGK